LLGLLFGVRVGLLRTELMFGSRSALRVSVTVRVRVWGYVRFMVRYGWTEVLESDFRGVRCPRLGANALHLFSTTAMR